MEREARAVVFHGAGQPLRVERFAVPEPSGEQVLVRVTGCTLCGSDLHTYSGRRNAPVPSVLGHEIVGRIAALGPAAPRHDLAGRDLTVGTRVTWSIVANCGGCFFCTRRLPQKCERMVKYGHERLRAGFEWTGGLADYVLLTAGTSLVRLPDELSDEAACPAGCVGATAAAILAAAGDVSGSAILVFGAGPLGLTACAMARSAGASEVLCCDVRRERLERAGSFGATAVSLPNELETAVRERTAGYGVDVALEASGAPEAFERSLSLTRTGGVIVLAGAVLPTPPVAVAPERLVRGHLTVRGVHNYAPPDLLRAVRFLAETRYPFGALVSAWLPLEETERAFAAARSADVFRIGVRP
jgi:alcohol dehydrogenase